jgi:hypothetical protein
MLPTFKTLRSRALVGLSVIAIAGSALLPQAAFALPISERHIKGCPVEDERGNVSYVLVGTRISLFHCGSDGEWHFGWLANN